MNSVILIGRFTSDPELKYSQHGTAICTFTLAVQRNKDEADFIKCLAFKGAAETIARYQKKGNQIAIRGRIQTRSYDGQNGKVYVTEVVVEEFTFLGSRQSEPKDPFQGESVEIDISDENLPF